MTDHLTGIGNRARFDDALSSACERSNRTGAAVVLLTMDLDGFKQVNDTHGHQAGDEVRHEVAHRLSALVRDDDVLARLGGDEFGIVLGGDGAAAVALASRIDADVRRPIALSGGSSVEVGVSIEVAASDNEVAVPTSLLFRADQGVYRAKQRAPGRPH